MAKPIKIIDGPMSVEEMVARDNMCHEKQLDFVTLKPLGKNTVMVEHGILGLVPLNVNVPEVPAFEVPKVSKN